MGESVKVGRTSGIELPEDHRVAVLSLRSGAALAKRICTHLGVHPSPHEELEFEDGEHKLRPMESVRGRDAYVVQSLYADDAQSIEDKLTRTLFLLAALRDASAARVTAVLPYLCYARMDRRTHPRDPVTSRYVAMLIEAVGVDRVVTVDVHNPAAYENGFRIRAEHLTATRSFVDALAPVLGDREIAVVSPDAGGMKRAERFRRALEARLQRPTGFGLVGKSRENGVVRGGTLAGDVSHRAAVIVDDLVASGTTLVRAAKACRDGGADVVYAAATHGVFSGDAASAIRGSAIERLFILDTIPPDRLDETARERIEVLDCAPMLAEAIHRLHTGGSITELHD